MCHYAALFPVFRVSGSRFFSPRIFKTFAARLLPCVTDRTVFSSPKPTSTTRTVFSSCHASREDKSWRPAISQCYFLFPDLGFLTIRGSNQHGWRAKGKWEGKMGVQSYTELYTQFWNCVACPPIGSPIGSTRLGGGYVNVS